ncbi:MAG TPA: M23 family metallopeptidase [Candidatus Coprenecus pullistercoris]|nr:M23 family metallopeptidase [Candidatus Coprenecus pullistercoris]
MGRLKYDKELLDFVEDRHPAMYHVLRVLKFVAYTLALVVLYYLVFTLFFSSEEERRMISERRLIEREYDALSGQVTLLENVVGGLEVKDEAIYRELFNTNFPDISFADTSLMQALSDTACVPQLVDMTYLAAFRLGREFDLCSMLIGAVADSLSETDPDMLRRIPSIMPIADFPLGNVGASLGRKMHPFYKEVVFHGGLDLVAPAGVEVRTTADGTVKSVERAMKLQGTRIVVDHGNGYETVYAHLSDVLVRKGQQVSRGDVIGRSGNSGTSFAPHLHYEVLRDGRQLDPLCFFNAELDTDSYAELLMYAANTGQSLD